MSTEAYAFFSIQQRRLPQKRLDAARTAQRLLNSHLAQRLVAVIGLELLERLLTHRDLFRQHIEQTRRSRGEGARRGRARRHGDGLGHGLENGATHVCSSSEGRLDFMITYSSTDEALKRHSKIKLDRILMGRHNSDLRMARGVWISDEERAKILRMRQDGVPVSTIAKQIERSTNFIYRMLKKHGFVSSRIAQQEPPAGAPSCSRNETVAPATVGVCKPIVETGHDRLMPDLADSSAALLCAVESMEVASYDPVPMPTQPRGIDKQPTLVQPSQAADNVDASVTFDNAPGAPPCARSRKSDAPDELWLTMDAPVVSMVQSLSSSNPSERNQVPTPTLSVEPVKKKQRTTTSITPSREVAQGPTQPVSKATASSLLTLQSQQRPQMPRKTTTDTADGMNGLLTRIQDEIRRLEGSALSDIYDAQLQQILVKVHADILLMQLQKTFSESDCRKLPRNGDAESKETGRLLRQKLAQEISLLKVQADRERLEMERLRHTTKSTVSTSGS
ncbi:hypothetical protein PsorP6_014217 [Peronosclerospora sorghi]|uniref:Uncharacterized protein n=1 Tax=Peronosclerospora sorghi TaxID=230839 RepID=A0ACC0VI02_9STRA|nr:hypothetical protein PsorP6_014217 [Peronosclerospora sorghi]